ARALHSFPTRRSSDLLLASALARRGVNPGDVVASLLPNIPQQAEAHFGVPACGAVLNTINIRLDAETVAYCFGHAGAKIVLCDRSEEHTSELQSRENL